MDTCTDGIDNDGDGHIDFDKSTGQGDWDCDEQNPDYTGEEDGNSNQYQNQSPP